MVRLTDGSKLSVRAIHRGDRALLLEHFAHLGAEARYRRFLSPIRELTEQQVQYFTHPDHRCHEGLFALDEEGKPVGVARYISTPEHPETAELAIAVVDGWRHRGVGRALVGELVRRARRAGVTELVAVMLADNRAMYRLLSALGPVRVIERDSGCVSVAVALDGPPAGVRKTTDARTAVVTAGARVSPDGVAAGPRDAPRTRRTSSKEQS